MRVLLFTDTLGDVNGVSRFVQDMAAAARRTRRDLRVVTSTRVPVEAQSNITNLRPLLATAMPGYPQLEITTPPLIAADRVVRVMSPDAVHVSTPGPVGIAGLMAARRRNIPVVGVYHTDFPAYIDKLFDDRALTWITGRAMSLVYRRFARVLSRSEHYSDRLSEIGIEPARRATLPPGVDLRRFGPERRDPNIWRQLGVPAQGAKVLYVGRVSVEKNLPLLATVWKRVVASVADRASGACAPAPSLVIVGDGPYRTTLAAELTGLNVHFLGFRHGDELATIYASSDLFIFPSLTDTLGQVVLESQVSGLPVLVSDIGGPQQLVRDGATGFVLPAGIPAEWCECVCALLCDEPRRVLMGAAAARAIGAMPIDGTFDLFWHIHEQVVREHARLECEHAVDGPAGPSTAL